MATLGTKGIVTETGAGLVLTPRNNAVNLTFRRSGSPVKIENVSESEKNGWAKTSAGYRYGEDLP